MQPPVYSNLDSLSVCIWRFAMRIAHKKIPLVAFGGQN